MAVGVETENLLRPSTSVIVRVLAPPVRHFAKPPGVKRHLPYFGGNYINYYRKASAHIADSKIIERKSIYATAGTDRVSRHH